MSHVLALLDRPRPRSLGLVPLVIDDGGKIQVLGLANTSAHRGRYMSREDVEHLIRAGHALRVDTNTLDTLSKRHVALWVGADFEEASNKLGLSLPPLPQKTFNADGGRFAVGDSLDLYAYLDAWTNAAFTRCLSQANEAERMAIADLMRWALPSDPRTLAASWQSATESSSELELQHRIFGSTFTLNEWKAELQRTIDGYHNPMDGMKVVAFVGGSASYRTEIASRFAGIVASGFASFTDTIKRRLNRASDPVAEKLDLMEHGQKLVESAPLAMTLDVLHSAAKSLQRKIVIDSVRHKEILDVIRWLTPRRVYVVSVTSPFERRSAELRNRGLDPKEVLAHPTETQIERLSKLANFTVDATLDWDPQLLKLSEHINDAYAS